MDLNNARVLLTGATGGIGAAIAAALAARGARLVLAGRRECALAAFATTLEREHGARCETVVADIGTAQGRDALHDCCLAGGGLQVLINNAGVGGFGLLEAQDDAAVAELINTNLLAPMLLAKRLLPLLQMQREAILLNVGSTFGSIGYPAFASYCASKFGLRGFSEALRRELADGPVRVLYLAPRATRTPLNSAALDALNAELGNRTDEPAVVAKAVVKLLAGRGKPVTYIGYPETLFARLNQVFSAPVDGALRKQLATIKRRALQPPPAGSTDALAAARVAAR